jgi:hypothetical protein
MSAVGKYNTEETRAWNAPTAETHKTIDFSKPFVAPPGLPLGLNTLDIDKGHNIRVKSYTSDITKTNFVAHVDSWADTVLYSAGVSWLDLAPGDLEYQTGLFSTTDDHPWNAPQALTSRRINFARPFVTPPKVISYLHSLDMANTANWRVKTTVSDIDAKGFTIHVDTWGDTVLYLGGAAWIAYPEDRPFVYSGTANIQDVRAWNAPAQANSKAIDFGNPNPPFWKTPSVFVALNSIDIDKKANLRIRAYVDNVSTNGLTWHIDSWGDTVLYSAGISYLCVEDSRPA